MPFNLLLLPLLGGYVFVRYFHRTRFHTVRVEKERLLIMSSIAGFFLTFLVYSGYAIASIIFPCSNWSFCVPSIWGKLVPLEYSGISVSAFLLGLVLWYPFNFFFNKEKEIDKVIEEDSDPLELLLRRSQKEKIPASITLASGKVYIGFISHQFNPGTKTNNISVLPIKSGHRDSNTQEMSLEVNYSKTLAKIKKDAKEIIKEASELAKNDTSYEERIQLVDRWIKLKNISTIFLLVIPVNQIISINLFDSDIHEKYFIPKPKGIEIKYENDHQNS